MPTSPSFSPLLLPITARVPEYLSDPLFSPSLLLLQSDQGWVGFLQKSKWRWFQEAQWGGDRVGGRKALKGESDSRSHCGLSLLGTLWGGIRMCLSLSLGGNLGIYPFTPIFPWLRAAPGLFILWMPISGLPCPWLAKPPGHWRTPRWRDRGKQGWAGSGHCTGYHPAQVHVSPELVQGTWGRISRAPATAIISPLEDHPSLSHSSAINHVPLIHPLRLLEGLPTGTLAGEDS